MPAGPCVICGNENYLLSAGGPTICPSCDCGNFGMERIKRQGAEIKRLNERIDNLRHYLEKVRGHDPSTSGLKYDSINDLINSAIFWAKAGIESDDLIKKRK